MADVPVEATATATPIAMTPGKLFWSSVFRFTMALATDHRDETVSPGVLAWRLALVHGMAQGLFQLPSTANPDPYTEYTVRCLSQNLAWIRTDDDLAKHHLFASSATGKSTLVRHICNMYEADDIFDLESTNLTN
jgi:hypothetical protein